VLGFWVLVLSIKDPFWVLANTKTQKVTLAIGLIILIIFSHPGAKFLGFWVFGFLDFRWTLENQYFSNPTGKLISTWAQVDPNDII
jgi:hypothetical protein